MKSIPTTSKNGKSVILEHDPSSLSPQEAADQAYMRALESIPKMPTAQEQADQTYSRAIEAVTSKNSIGSIITTKND